MLWWTFSYSSHSHSHSIFCQALPLFSIVSMASNPHFNLFTAFVDILTPFVLCFPFS